MLGISTISRIYISCRSTDMRKSFDGLCGSVEQEFSLDPVSGYLFVFFNRRRTITKMLFWEHGGFWIYSRRLERGTFSLGSIRENGEITLGQLFCILDGIEFVRRRRRFILSK
jgi:transposase